MLGSTPLTVVDALLRGMVLALLLLLASLLWRQQPRSTLARAGITIAFGLCIQVISSAPLIEELLPRYWQAPLVGISVGNAVLFWIFVQAMFDDDFVLHRAHAAIWLTAVALGALGCILGRDNVSGIESIAANLRHAVPLIFALLATVAAASHWRSDLVEGRRRLRAFIVVTGVAYTIALLAARLVSPQRRLSGVLATVDVFTLLVITGVLVFHWMTLRASELLPAGSALAPARIGPLAPGHAPQVGAASPDPAEERLVVALEQAMKEERGYRMENLTVATLAARLGVPEYRLRRVINRRLGFRNFNAYVNSLRLDETFAALSNPAQRELPVLTIALEAGFHSIGPFNRAFKAATGLTPTEFRRTKLAET